MTSEHGSGEGSRTKDALKWVGIGGIIAGLVFLGEGGIILVLAGGGAYALSRRKKK